MVYSKKGDIRSEKKLVVFILSVPPITFTYRYYNLHEILKWSGLGQMIAKVIADAILKWLDLWQLTAKSDWDKIAKITGGNII